MFVCQDVLGTDWAVRSAPGPADAAAAVPSCALRASSVAHTEPETNCPQQTGESSAFPSTGTAMISTHTAAAQTVAGGLRQLSSACPPKNNSLPNVALQKSHDGEKVPKPCGAEEDFDDWDVDLADLDECQMERSLPPPAPPVPSAISASSAKMLRPSFHGGLRLAPDQNQSELSTPCQVSTSSTHKLSPRPLPTSLQSPSPRPVFPSAAKQSPNVFTAPSPISRPHSRPQQPQRPWATPGPSPQARGLFETVSPAPSSSTLSPHPLHTPVLTNHLVQLVSASTKLSNKRARSGFHRPRTRRFPGPAGLLPEQVSLILTVQFLPSLWSV